MRRVTIKLRSAKVVNTNCKVDTKTVGRYGIKPTDITNDMDNLIHFNHISNMFHVMMGSRPVSSRYDTKRKRSQYLDEIVRKGLIHYDNSTSVVYTTKSGEERICYNNEFTQGNKPFVDSNRKSISVTASNGEVSESYLTWAKLSERSKESDGCKEVLKILNDFGIANGIENIRKEYSLLDALIKVRDYDEWYNKLLKVNGVGPIISFLKREPSSGFNNQNNHFSYNRASLVNMNAVTPKVSVDATVVLYLTDEDAENLLNAKSIATILDNGYAEIEGNPQTVKDFPFIDNNDIDDDIEWHLEENYVKISTLPTTKPLNNEKN